LFESLIENLEKTNEMDATSSFFSCTSVSDWSEGYFYLYSFYLKTY